MCRLQSLHERTLAERNFILQQKDTKILELEQELEGGGGRIVCSERTSSFTNNEEFSGQT